MIVKLDVGRGIATDQAPEELQPGVWSAGANVVFREGFAVRAPGAARIFDAPTVTPYFVAPFRVGASLFWLHAGLARVFVDDGTTRSDITRTTPYTGTPADRWTGGNLNGIFILNNGVQPPQFWNGNPATKFADLTNWTAGYTCRCLRPWKNILVALDITKSGTRYPWRFLSSAIADPGTVPPSWNPADPSREAYENDVPDAAGPLIDCLPLGEQLVVYTTASAHAVREIGGRQFLGFQTLPLGFGMLARHCAAVTPRGHVVLTAGDVMLHNGQEGRSIAGRIVRRAIFDSLDNSYADRACFVVANPPEQEVWICYPIDGSPVANRAAVWNWADETWGFRDLRNVTHGAVGQTPLAMGERWSTIGGTWTDNAAKTWGSKMAGQNDQHLVLSSLQPSLALVGYGAQDVGVSMRASVERIGMHFDAPNAIKRISTVWPRIDAPAGTVVYVEVGQSKAPDVEPTWKPAKAFTVGTSKKVSVSVSGRFLSLRLSSTADAVWRVKGVDLDVEVVSEW